MYVQYLWQTRTSIPSVRGETKALIGVGGVYSYIRVLPDEFLLKSVVVTERNSSGRTRVYEYAAPPINTLVSALPSVLYLYNSIYAVYIYSLYIISQIYISQSFSRMLHQCFFQYCFYCFFTCIFC